MNRDARRRKQEAHPGRHDAVGDRSGAAVAAAAQSVIGSRGRRGAVPSDDAARIRIGTSSSHNDAVTAASVTQTRRPHSLMRAVGVVGAHVPPPPQDDPVVAPALAAGAAAG